MAMYYQMQDNLNHIINNIIKKCANATINSSGAPPLVNKRTSLAQGINTKRTIAHAQRQSDEEEALFSQNNRKHAAIVNATPIVPSTF